MIDINMFKTTLLTNLLSNSGVGKYLLLMDLIIAIFSVVAGLSIFQYIFIEITVTLLIKTVLAVVQTNKTIRYQIKNDAVKSINKLFKYKA